MIDIKQLTELGFEIFPVTPNAKTPVIKDFAGRSTSNREAATQMWIDPVMGTFSPFNAGISTTSFKGGALVVVDVDVKGDKRGIDTLNRLELSGQEFPETLTQTTPTGGLHLIYLAPSAVKQGVEVLGGGLDIRSKGGYIVAAGSTIDGKEYSFKNIKTPVAKCPQWILDKCKETTKPVRKNKNEVILDTDRALGVAEEFLKKAAPAIEGEGGDYATYKVCAKLKDLGVSVKAALTLLEEHWNPQCAPPWTTNDLEAKLENAYAYGQNDIGADTPQAEFSVVPRDEKEDKKSPIEEINKDYSFIVLGGKSMIIKSTDTGDVFMNCSSFHELELSKVLQVGEGKPSQLSRLWLASPLRRTFDRMDLLPEMHVPHGVYNLWQGFSVEPTSSPTQEMIDGVEMLKEHTLDNICQSDAGLYNWLMGYFAHMIQKPYQKPSTALVFRGEKGVGKNALIERIGGLVKAHFLLTSNKRYLTSNFNAHLSRLLLFVLDEAFWSGDKASEGVLKDLITGSSHLIEQKGREMFIANNLSRVAIIGNEEWLVPSSQDERRFAVFNIGNGRQQDHKFFQTMVDLIDYKGGNRLLMRYLLDFDLKSINVNKAPDTLGLRDQKVESLHPVFAWWLQSLQDGTMANMEFATAFWPEQVARKALRDAFSNYAREIGIRSRMPAAAAFGRMLNTCCPSITDKRITLDKQRQWNYKLPTLTQARKEFDEFMRQPMEWIPDPHEVDVFG